MLRFSCLLLFFFPFALHAQFPESSEKNSFPDTTSLIRKSSPDKKHIIINAIKIEGNATTKQYIILREVPFSIGDTIEIEALPKILTSTKENLLNTSLFHFVTLDTSSVSDGKLNLLITVVERWYTWPIPIFEIQERNFNVWWETKNFKRTNYGFFLNRENFRGRREELNLIVQLGYTEKYGIIYRIPYLNKKETFGMGASFSYSRNKEVAYKTLNNKLVYFKNPDNFVREELISRITMNYREGIYNTQTFEAKFSSVKIADTLKILAGDYFIPGEAKSEYLTLYYSFVHDHRDSKAYPLKGYYYDFELTKHGLGILKNENLTVFHLTSSVRKYRKIFERAYLSYLMKGKISSAASQPYYVQRGLGYKQDYLRSYEYYVIDGQNYGMLKAGFKYEIIQPHVKKISFIPSEKFNTFHYALYGGIFGDAGYVDDTQHGKENPMANKLLYGGGIGIDYVTYYDTVLRLEYAINHLGEQGLFIHLSKAF